MVQRSFNTNSSENSALSKLAHVESVLQDNQDYHSNSDTNSNVNENEPFISVDKETMSGSFGKL